MELKNNDFQLTLIFSFGNVCLYVCLDTVSLSVFQWMRQYGKGGNHLNSGHRGCWVNALPYVQLFLQFPLI